MIFQALIQLEFFKSRISEAPSEIISGEKSYKKTVSEDVGCFQGHSEPFCVSVIFEVVFLNIPFINFYLAYIFPITVSFIFGILEKIRDNRTIEQKNINLKLVQCFQSQIIFFVVEAIKISSTFFACEKIVCFLIILLKRAKVS